MPPTHIVIKAKVPIEYASRLTSALSNNYKYPELVPDEELGMVENPVTAQQFIMAKRIQEIKDHLIAFEVPDLAKDDRQDRIDEINAIPITVEITPE